MSLPRTEAVCHCVECPASGLARTTIREPAPPRWPLQASCCCPDWPGHGKSRAQAIFRERCIAPGFVTGSSEIVLVVSIWFGTVGSRGIQSGLDGGIVNAPRLVRVATTCSIATGRDEGEVHRIRKGGFSEQDCSFHERTLPLPRWWST